MVLLSIGSCGTHDISPGIEKGRRNTLSGIGFLPTCMESGFVSVGAGEVGWWSGDPCGRPSSFHREGRGRPQGSPPFPSPPPPLRRRGAFSPKNLYLRDPHPHPVRGRGNRGRGNRGRGNEGIIASKPDTLIGAALPTQTVFRLPASCLLRYGTHHPAWIAATDGQRLYLVDKDAGYLVVDMPLGERSLDEAINVEMDAYMAQGIQANIVPVVAGVVGLWGGDPI